MQSSSEIAISVIGRTWTVVVALSKAERVHMLELAIQPNRASVLSQLLQISHGRRFPASAKTEVLASRSRAGDPGSTYLAWPPGVGEEGCLPEMGGSPIKAKHEDMRSALPNPYSSSATSEAQVGRGQGEHLQQS